MSQTVTVTCDACNRDLSGSESMPVFRLVLQSEPIPNRGDMVFAVHVRPSVPEPGHFCGLGCLCSWLENHR